MIAQILKDLDRIYEKKPNRYKHVLGVRDTALKLGKQYDLNLRKLELASLLHDITKYHDTAWHEQIIKDHFDNYKQIISSYNKHILHAFSAYVIAKTEYHINDEDILNSILNHTIGKPGMTLYEKIIFISDYIEPNRTYDSCEKVRNIAFKDLDLAVYTAIDDSIKFYEANNGDIPDIAYTARQFYQEFRRTTMTKLEVIKNSLESVNLKNIEIYDMREKSPFFDYFIISTASSSRQLSAIVTHLHKDLAEASFPHPNVEGKNSESWVLIDCKDVIVNVFTEEERQHYNLEKMLVEYEKLQ